MEKRKYERPQLIDLEKAADWGQGDPCYSNGSTASGSDGYCQGSGVGASKECYLAGSSGPLSSCGATGLS